MISVFQSKRKLRETVAELTRRVEDLEERLCPMNEHDWKQVDYEIVSFTKGIDTDVIYKDKCRRCGKTRIRIG